MSSAALLLFVLYLFSPLIAGVSLSSTGSTLVLDDVPYYIPPTPFAHVKSLRHGQFASLTAANGLVAATVIGSAGLDLVTWEKDDVWSSGFLGGR